MRYERAGRRLDLLADAGERRDRAEHLAHQAHERDEPADGEVAVEDEPRAEAEHDEAQQR